MRAMLAAIPAAMVVAACTLLPAPPRISDGVEIPRIVDGIPVLTVSEAMKVRDGGRSDRIAVFGWWSETPPHSCPAPMGPDGTIRDPHPLELYCRVGDWALAELREPVADVRVTDHGGSTSVSVQGRTMAGPWIQPALVGDVGPIVDATAADRWAPHPVVLLGHFHDASAQTCPAEAVRACDERFVADKAIPLDQ